jgi:hypothetical protein
VYTLYAACLRARHPLKSSPDPHLLRILTLAPVAHRWQTAKAPREEVEAQDLFAEQMRLQVCHCEIMSVWW